MKTIKTDNEIYYFWVYVSREYKLRVFSFSELDDPFLEVQGQ